MRVLASVIIGLLLAGPAAAQSGWGDDSRDERHLAKVEAKQAKAEGKQAIKEARRSERVEQLLATQLNSGVCDVLKDATPGLRFMCMAFCELQTCTPDFTAEDPFESCSRSSEWILARYQKRQGPGDPDMPCIQEPEEVAECPCWSPNELAGLRAPDGTERVNVCFLNMTSGDSRNWDAWQLIDNPRDPLSRTTSVASIEAQGVDGAPACSLADTCDPATELCLNTARQMSVTPEQFAACERDVAMSAMNRGFNCTDYGTAQ